MIKNNYGRKIQTFLFFVLLTAFTAGCTHDKDHDGLSDDHDKCPSVFAKTNDGCPITKPALKNVHVFIETSASMGGYFRKDADYKEIVSDLVVKVKNFDLPLDIWFVADSMSKYPKTVTDFTNDIATTKIADQKSSELHRIINNIADKTDSTDISILVSDCILSFPVNVIKANWEINKTDASSTLKNNIYTTFSALRKRGLATSVYAFKSKFYGVYYDYHNVKTKLDGESRPFYIWVIGNSNLLSKFDDKLSEISTFQPDKALHFGLLDSVITKYNIVPSVEKIGKWKVKHNNIEDVYPTASEPSQFCVAVNLSHMPAYARDVKYLEENIQLECQGCQANFKVKEKKDADLSKVKTETQKAQMEDATHVFLISINKMNLSSGNIKINLPLKYDNWYKDWSTMDDRDSKAVINKTFAFEHLIHGVIEAYDTKSKNLINISINLNK